MAHYQPQNDQNQLSENYRLLAETLSQQNLNQGQGLSTPSAEVNEHQQAVGNRRDNDMSSLNTTPKMPLILLQEHVMKSGDSALWDVEDESKVFVL